MDKGSTTIEEEILKEMEDVIRKAAEAPLPAPEKPPEAPPAAPPGAPSEAPPAPPAAPEAPPKDLVEAVKKALSEKPGEKVPKAPPEKPPAPPAAPEAPPKAPEAPPAPAEAPPKKSKVPKRPGKPKEEYPKFIVSKKIKPEERAAVLKEIEEAEKEEEEAEAIKRKAVEEEEKELTEFKEAIDRAEKVLTEVHKTPVARQIEYFRRRIRDLKKEESFYEQKKKILEDKIREKPEEEYPEAIVPRLSPEEEEAMRKEIEEAEKEEVLAKGVKELEEAQKKEEEEKIKAKAQEIFEKRTRGEEPYTKETIEKILKDAGVKPEDAEAFLKEWDRKEAERLIQIEKEEKKKFEEEQEQKLQELKAAREKLVRAEKNMKEFEGLAGLFKGFIKREEKTSVAEEFEKAEREYKEARAEFVAGDFERIVKERSDLADQKAEKLYKERGRLYKFWKNLGELNLAAAYKKIAGREIKSKILRFGARIISVRTGISAGLLGLGIAAGAGTAAGIGIFLARRGFAGLGAGVGTYDLLKLGTEKWAATKGWRAEVVPEELEKMKIEEIEERMAHFEVNAPFVGKKVSENETYLKLSERYKELKNQEAEKNADKLQAFLNKSMEEADGKLEAVKAKSKRNERIIKGLAVGAGIFAGSGVISKLISGKWGWEQFGRVGAVESQTAVKAQTEVNLETAENQLRLPDEFVSKIAGPDRLLGSQEMASLTGLEKYLSDAGLDPQSEEVVRGLGIENIGDISKAEVNLESLLGVTKDPEIIKSVVERGLDADDAENLKALMSSVGKLTLSEDLKRVALQGAITNNFESQTEFLNIVQKIDLDHLRSAGILKPDGAVDIEKFHEIVGAKTLEVHHGDSIWKVLKEYYTAPKAKGGLGLGLREAREKIIEQLKNPALLKQGKLQDLVEAGDQFKVDREGNVLLFVAEDGKMGRLRDVLHAISGTNDIRAGRTVFDLAEGVKVKEVASPLTGHMGLRITDLEGVTHKIADYDFGPRSIVDGKRVVLEEWLKEHGLLAKKTGELEIMKEYPEEVANAPSTGDLEEFSEMQREFSEQQQFYLENLKTLHTNAVAEGNTLQADTLLKKIHSVEEAVGTLERAEIETKIMEKGKNLNRLLEVLGFKNKVEDLKTFSPEELSVFGKKIGKVLKEIPGRRLTPDGLKTREHLELLHNYAEELKSGS